MPCGLGTGRIHILLQSRSRVNRFPLRERHCLR